MNKLLHSKKLRNNFIKWLSIYFIVMLSLTSVITYSRYISSQTTKSEAHVAKFNIDVIPGEICSHLRFDEGSGECDITEFKYYDTIDYYFKVNTEDLEVKTIIAFTLSIDSNFTVVELDPLEAGDSLDSIYNTTLNQVKFQTEVGLDGITEKTYRIRLKCSGNLGLTYSNIVHISYSALQKN